MSTYKIVLHKKIKKKIRGQMGMRRKNYNWYIFLVQYNFRPMTDDKKIRKRTYAIMTKKSIIHIDNGKKEYKVV